MSHTIRKHARNITFNQDGSCICLVNNKDGFQIIDSNTLDNLYSESSGTYSHIQLYYKSSLMIMVGLGEDIKISPRQLVIRNIETQEQICEFFYPDTISNVKVNVDRLVVSLQDEIYVYNLATMKLLHVIKNLRKLNGLIDVSMGVSDSNLLMYPTYSVRRRQSMGTAVSKNSQFSGDTRISADVNEINEYGVIHSTVPNADNESSIDINHAEDNEVSPDNYDDMEVTKAGDIIIFDMTSLRPLMVIEAHQNAIKCVCMSKDGSMIATASKLGTIIRVFDTTTGKKKYEFRRGTYRAIIQNIEFSKQNNFLIVTSSSSTIHIFELEPYEIPMESINVSIHETNEQDLVLLDTNINNFNDDIGRPDTANSIINGERSSKSNTMKQLLKKSSKRITREATKKFNEIFINKSQQEKNDITIERNFAWCKFPIDKAEIRGQSSEINIVNDPIILTKIQVEQLKSVVSNTVQSNEKTVHTSASGNTNSTDENGSMLFLPIQILTLDGNLYTFLLDPINGGECLLQSQLFLLL
ncbi:autophagy protein [Maudiozyma exigua]|uniref:Autophagy protein n=1 Tax=Maudiozyma exigua TaxID=34358 RepID=A0A9P6WC27_MAUEX|nr:autophagy protein [Kazachstania exigua]